MSNQNPKLAPLLIALEDMQAIDIVVIDVQQQTTITDLMVICAGRSLRHVNAIAEQAMDEMKKAGIPPINTSGLDNSEWALIDFGDIILHVMQPATREFFNLEGLWQKDVESKDIK